MLAHDRSRIQDQARLQSSPLPAPGAPGARPQCHA